MVLKNGQEITHFCKEEIQKAQALSSDLKEGYWLGKYIGIIEAYESLLALIEGNKNEEPNPFIYIPKNKISEENINAIKKCYGVWQNNEGDKKS